MFIPRYSHSSAVKHYTSYVFQLLKKFPNQYILGSISIILLNALEMLPPIFFKLMIDNKAQSYGLSLSSMAFILLGSFFLISFLRFAWRYFFIITSRKIETGLQRTLFAKLLNAPYSSVHKLKIGEVVSLLSQDVSNFRIFMGPGILVLIDMLAYLIFVPLVLLWWIGPSALLVLIPMIFISLYMPYYDKKISALYESNSESLAKLSDHVYENSIGAKIFRVLGLIGIRRGKFSSLINEIYEKRFSIGKIDIVLGLIIDTSIFFSYCLLLIFTFMAIEGRYDLIAIFATHGSVVLVLQMLDKLIWPMMATSWIASQMEQSKASLERLKEIFHLPEMKSGPYQMMGAITDLTIRKLNFRFSPQEAHCLKDIDLDLRKGMKIGIVGEVGSGKSTLLKILATLYSADELDFHTFKINDQNYQDLDLDHLRAQISYISQEATIFNNTITNNICPYPVTSLEKVKKCLDLANLTPDLESFPEGLNTEIGEKGINLSGGQKQRVAMARSFYSNASLYLWDDAISALDLRTERKVIASLFKINPESILVLSTHRPSALRSFDQILVLHQGEVKERGKFSELMHKKGMFYQLYQYESKTMNLRSQQSEAR